MRKLITANTFVEARFAIETAVHRIAPIRRVCQFLGIDKMQRPPVLCRVAFHTLGCQTGTAGDIA